MAELFRKLFNIESSVINIQRYALSFTPSALSPQL
jgi:hypothetical protein